MKKRDLILSLSHLPTDQIREKANCSQAYVLRILNGKITPRAQKRQAIEALAHLPINEIAEKIGCTKPYVHAVLRKAKDTPCPKQFFQHSDYYKY